MNALVLPHANRVHWSVPRTRAAEWTGDGGEGPHGTMRESLNTHAHGADGGARRSCFGNVHGHERAVVDAGAVAESGLYRLYIAADVRGAHVNAAAA